MTLSGKQWTITAGDHTATIVEVGAGLLRYEVAGRDITCSYGDGVLPPKCCGTTLVPWPNRLAGGTYDFEGQTQQLALTEPDGGNAIHGLGRWVRWTPVRQETDLITLGLDIVPQKGYPFEVRAEVTYTVHPDRGLAVSLGARNLGAGRAPFGAGSHPYLATHGPIDDVTLTLPATEQLVLDERQLPVGTRTLTGHDDYRGGRRVRSTRFDAGFTGIERDPAGRGFAEVRTATGGARLWFDETFGFLQVFTVDDVTPGQSGIAVEPMTCAPNAFNTGAGLIVLEPDGTWAGSWGIQPL